MKYFYIYNKNVNKIIKMDSITEQQQQQQMNEVMEELKDECAKCICDLIEYDVGMSQHEFMICVRIHLSHWLTASPFWEYFMHRRYCYGFYNNSNAYEDINENVLYDYALVVSIPFTKEQHDYKNKQNMWRNVQREKMLLLYGKVPTDILNEMLNYM